MLIKVLGGGCNNCRVTIANVEKALEKTGIQADIVKVEDYVEIMQYDVLSTPGLVIDEALKTVGRVPTVPEIVTLLTEAQSAHV